MAILHSTVAVQRGLPSRPADRIEVLDAMRGVAALAVVMYHYCTRYAEVHGGSARPIALEFPWGQYGVDLFFMISGYVIAMTLNRTGRGLDFAVSRFSRLFPAYWVSVLLTYVAVSQFGQAAVPSWHLGLTDLVWNLTMLQEFVHRPSVDGVYWTLTIELRFYALMFLCHALGATRRPALLVSVWLVLCLSQQIMPGFLRVNLMLEWFPLFGIGVLAFAARQSGWTWTYMLVFVFALGINALNRGLEAGLIGGVLSAIFIGLITKIRARVPSGLLWLGSISYPLYLLHQYIGFIVIWHLPNAWGWILAVAVSLGLAWLVHRYVEDPTMQWIRRSYKQWQHDKITQNA